MVFFSESIDSAQEYKNFQPQLNIKFYLVFPFLGFSFEHVSSRRLIDP